MWNMSDFFSDEWEVLKEVTTHGEKQKEQNSILIRLCLPSGSLQKIPLLTQFKDH